MNSELTHHGIKGMKWGRRRYQNTDGSLTPAGKKRYSDKEISDYRKRKMAEAPSKAESPRGANKGWYKNAPKSTLIREMRAEDKASAKKLKWDNDSDSAVTKRTKKDYNELSDEEFRRKYQTSKSTYAKRVEKYGDPYMNSPLAKYGKKQGAKQRLSEEKRQAVTQFNEKAKALKDVGRGNDVDAITKLAREYDLNLADANARYHRYLSKHNIETDKNYNKAVEIVRKQMSDLSQDYTLVYDVTTQMYTLRDKKS